MKTKIKLLLLLLCLLNIGQIWAQVPPVYTNIPAGNQSLLNLSVDSTLRWYKWSNADPIAYIELYLNSNGNQYKLSSAELYTETGGTLTLQSRDTIQTNNTMRVYAQNLAPSTNLYLCVKNVTVTCPSCSGQLYPNINMSLSSLASGCTTLTQPPCEFVKDGSFESYSLPCSAIGIITLGFGSIYNQFAPCYWSLPNGASSVYDVGTADYYNTCAYTPPAVNFTNAANANYNLYSGSIGYPSPHTNQGYGGFIAYFPVSSTDFKEYLSQSLSSSLISGNVYTLRAWVRLSYRSRYGVQNISAFLSNSLPTQTGASTLPTTGGQLVNFNIASPITDKNNWTLITATFTANASYSQMTIGNFVSYTSTTKTDLNPGNYGSADNQYMDNMSYYYIDDVSLKGTGNISVTQGPTICAGTTTTLAVTPSTLTPYTWSSTPTTSTLSTVTAGSVAVSPSVTTTYTVTTGAAGCNNTDVTTVVVGGSPISLQASSNPVCAGQTITLTAYSNISYSNYNWYTSPGFYTSTSSNTFAVTPNSTGVKTYTVVGTNSGGCSGVSYVQVTVNPMPSFTLVPSPACAGGIVTFTSTANSYILDNGNGYNCFSPGGCQPFSYYNTGNYTATFTGTLGGCVRTYTQNITVNAPQASFSYSLNNCGGGYCFTNLSSCSSGTYTTWQWTYTGATGVVGTSTLSAPCFTFANTGTYTVSLTMSNNASPSGTVTSTTTQTLFATSQSSLCCATPAKTFTTGTLSSQQSGSSYGAGLVAVTGTLTVDVNFTFSTTQLRMAPNAQIVVAATKTLTLDGAHLFACTNMWEGIILNNGSQLITQQNGSTNQTTIEDAHFAVFVNASGMASPSNISASNTIFGKNFIGIRIDNYSSTANYPISMGNVTIQGNIGSVWSPGSTIKPYISGGTTYNYSSTQYGMRLYNVGKISVGSGTTLGNTFQNLDIGVRALQSNADVVKATFQNLSSGYANKAIWSTGAFGFIVGGYGTEYKLNVGLTSSNQCVFKNLQYGIYTDSCMTMDIEQNLFRDVNGAAITVNRSNYYRTTGGLQNIATISYNTIEPFSFGANISQNGISYYDNTKLTAATNNNTITLLPNSSYSSEGITVYQTSPSNTSAHTINTNRIIGSGDKGVHISNVATATITGNYIITQVSGSGNSKGIQVEAGSANSIQTNTVDATAYSGNQNGIAGIDISQSQSNTIWCNSMLKTEKGLNTYGDCSYTNLDGNTFDDNYRAIYLAWSLIGPQQSATAAVANDFKNMTSPELHTMAYYSNGNQSPYYSIANTPPPNQHTFIPTLNSNISGTNIPVAAPVTKNSRGATCLTGGGARLAMNLPDGHDGAEIWLAEQIAGDDLSFIQYDSSLRQITRIHTYAQLANGAIDRNASTTIHNFYTDAENGNMGILKTGFDCTGDPHMADSLQGTIITLLQSVNPHNQVEQNYKDFSLFYLTKVHNQPASLSAQDMGFLQNLAQKCPLSDGNTVYSARALLRIKGDNTVYQNACEIIPSGDGSVTQKHSAVSSEPVGATQHARIFVYPNPANDRLFIGGDNLSGATITILSIYGDVMLNSIAIVKEGIAVDHLPNGTYLYTIRLSDGSVVKDRLMIIR